MTATKGSRAPTSIGKGSDKRYAPGDGYASTCGTVTIEPGAKLVKNLGEVTTSISLADGDIVTGALTGKPVKIAAGATVTLRNVSVDNSSSSYVSGIECLGNATIILEGTNTVKGGERMPGILAAENATLTIEGDGSITATGGSQGAGITALSCGFPGREKDC